MFGPGVSIRPARRCHEIVTFALSTCGSRTTAQYRRDVLQSFVRGFGVCFQDASHRLAISREGVRMRKWIIFFSAIGLAVTAQSISVAASDTGWDRTVLPRPPQPFEGVTKKTLEGSVASFTQAVKAPPDAPNILLVLIDDAGFGNPSTFGGPVATSTFDKLAAEGLRYNRFHVTALCSPTRAALLSGRNHHAVGFGSIAEIPGGWPGYNTNWPTSAASIAQILQANGYNTAAIGKWHLTPDSQQGPAGPLDRCPDAPGLGD